MLIRLASLHLFARKCSLMRGFMNYQEGSVEKFKLKASVVHGGKYDYSKVILCDQKTKVEIICPLHGSFFQRKDSHCKGAGCKQCVYENVPPKYTIEEIITRFKEVHGEKFDYSLVTSSKSMDKVDIVCEHHGVFRQTVAHHLVAKGCPTCSSEALKLPLEEFIVISSEVHAGKYTYDKVSHYPGYNSKVTITCPEHGDFQQPAGPHMQGKGCRACGVKVSIGKRYTEFTTENFISKIKAIHGDRYDYSLTEYINTETKVKIICPIHGMFEQRPKCHERGKGCAKCRNDNTTYNFIQKYRGNPELGSAEGMVYVLRVTGNGEDFLKLGITSNKSGRFKRYRKQFKDVGYSYEILLESYMPNYQSAMLENDIFKQLRLQGMMYKPSMDFSGKSECVLIECFEQIKHSILNHTKDKYFD